MGKSQLRVSSRSGWGNARVDVWPEDTQAFTVCCGEVRVAGDRQCCVTRGLGEG